jgi:formylmethanofuran dehydrogenase subunit B
LATIDRVEPHVTCLGCGCACDDVDIAISNGRIVDTGRACTLGAAWFGDGSAPGRVLLNGSDASLDAALASAARMLTLARRPIVYLAPGLSCEAQRLACALADRCRARLDNVSSSTVFHGVLAAQETGRATATLGEARNRADVVVMWDVVPARYPRLAERYAIDPPGLDVPDGRRGRRVIAVTVRARPWPDADDHVPLTRADEVPTIEALAALLAGATPQTGEGQVWSAASALADQLLTGRYVAVFADAEPVAAPSPPGRAAALWRLSHALNERTRGAVIALRAGGNRTGAESVMTAQAGYPMAVDFGGGAPRYRPHDGSAPAGLRAGEVDAVLVLGDAGAIEASVIAQLMAVPSAVLGPGASDGPLAGGRLAIDTARAGVHEAGTALRLDDVPLPLRRIVDGPAPAAAVLARLLELLP